MGWNDLIWAAVPNSEPSWCLGKGEVEKDLLLQPVSWAAEAGSWVGSRRAVLGLRRKKQPDECRQQ